MPSRRWHVKSRLGCIRCKSKRVKCDEQRPVCSNCARSSDSCVYATSIESNSSGLVTELTETQHPLQDNIEQSQVAVNNRQFVKRWHRKARSGCLKCRNRRIKCDETLPICGHCNQAKLTCVYPSQHLLSKEQEGSPVMVSAHPTRLHVAGVSDGVEVMAFEFFDIYVLSMFRACQPSILWSHTIGYSTQTNDALRHVAIALGFQQRLSEGFVDDAPTSYMDAQYQSDIFYGNAIRSLREMLNKAPAIEGPIVALCCLLMVSLETLRGSPKSLIIHLHNAVRITVQARGHNNHVSSDELLDISALLQNLCISSYLYCTSPSYAGDYALIMQDIDFYQLSVVKPSVQQTTSALDVSTFICEVIYATRQLMHPHLLPYERLPLFDQMYRLRTKAINLQSRLPSTQTNIVNRNIMEAKLINAQLFLEAVLTRNKDLDTERRGFNRILDLLHESLIRLNSPRYLQPYISASHPFTIGTAAIHMLETMLQAGHGSPLEDRALELLKLCPVREGLWMTQRVVQSHHMRKATENQQLGRNPTFAMDAQDQLASREDCVVIAQEMLEDLQLHEKE